MLKPSTFDPARRYPFITYVYGEPAGVTATNQWQGGTMLFHRALAEAGAFELEAFPAGTSCDATWELEAGEYTLF